MAACSGNRALLSRQHADTEQHPCARLLQDQPTFVSLVAYFGFWALVVMDIIIKWRRGMLLDALAKSRKREARAAAKLARKQARRPRAHGRWPGGVTPESRARACRVPAAHQGA